jgi:uncharacterized protein (DUF1810 family)
MPSDLTRFLRAQERDYTTALEEIRAGRKQSHWMWYIFPQLSGLGFSETSRYYALADLAEAKAFLEHDVLGPRLVGICKALLALPTRDANAVFGTPDDMKLRSCMTLFASVPGAPPVFQEVLVKFFGGRSDERTIDLLSE